MTFVHALLAMAVAGLIAGGSILALRKKRSPVPPARFVSPGPAQSSPVDKAALTELAGKAVARYPEIGSTPAELLAEISTYLGKARPSPANTSRIILEKMLGAGSLRQATSYWQVHEFLGYHEKLRKTRRT